MTSQPTTAVKEANPFLRSLLAFAFIGLGGGLACGFAIMYQLSEFNEVADLVAWGSIFAAWGMLSLLLWMLGSAMTWKSNA